MPEKEVEGEGISTKEKGWINGVQAATPSLIFLRTGINSKGITMKTFKLFWLDGKEEIVKGTDIANAMNKAGYGAGALAALDYYEEI